MVINNAANGMIVPDLASPMESKSLDEMRDTLFQRIRSIRRHCRYLKAKTISNRNILKRKSSKRLHCILQDYADIGETIEKFVIQCRCRFMEKDRNFNF